MRNCQRDTSSQNPPQEIIPDIFVRFDIVPILYGLYIPPFAIPTPRIWPARGCNSGDSILGAEEISFIVKCFSSSRTLTISNAVANGKLKTRSERPGPRVCCINISCGCVCVCFLWNDTIYKGFRLPFFYSVNLFHKISFKLCVHVSFFIWTLFRRK